MTFTMSHSYTPAQAVYRSYLLPNQGLPHRDPRLMPQIRPLLNIGVVAGGAARRVILGDLAPFANDIDVFLPTEKSEQEAYAQLVDLGYMMTGDNGMGGTTWELNVFDFVADPPGRAATLPVQLVRSTAMDVLDGRFHWTGAKSVIETFTLTAEMFALELVQGEVVALHTTQAEEDTRSRTARFHLIINPIRAAYRMVKYGLKGFQTDPAEVSKAFETFIGARAHQQGAWLESQRDWYGDQVRG